MFLKNLVTNRPPPVIVFFFTFVCFTLSTLILALVVRRSDRLLDEEAFSWNKLLSKITHDYSYCVHVQHGVEFNVSMLNNSIINSSNRKNATVQVPISTDFINSLLAATDSTGAKVGHVRTVGQIEVKHMNHGLLERYRNEVLEMTMDLAPRTGSQDQQICISINGPEKLLDELNSGSAPSNCSLSQTPDRWLHFESGSKIRPRSGFCQNGTSLEFTYEMQPNWTILISAGDKELIHLHLLCTSAFLFVLGLVMLVVTASKSSFKRKAGDARGDLELLPQYADDG